MKKHLVIAASCTAAFLSGCSIQPIRTFESPTIVNLSQLVQSGEYRQKADIFYAVMDASSSMAEDYKGNNFRGDSTATKFSIEKLILRRLNKSATKLNLGAAIRTYGYTPCMPFDISELTYGSNQYNAADYRKSLGKTECTSGGSPLTQSLKIAEKDLEKSTGNISMLLLSDGYNLNSSPVQAVQSLKNKYGDRLCLYTVWVGNAKEEAGQALLAELANIAGCGFAKNAEDIGSERNFDEFAKGVFLTKDIPPPVVEPLPPPVIPAPPVDGDDDQDGIPNSKDKCPKTPKGATVNQDGCWIIEGVKFDFDKSIIKPEFYPKLNNVVEVIRQNPGLNIDIKGHTDNRGTAAYNLPLSIRRAKAVKAYLLPRIDNKATLTTKGYGLTKPEDTNATAAGRANNRRVQLDILD
jgi:OmpA-OmpF porin, OOP family